MQTFRGNLRVKAWKPRLVNTVREPAYEAGGVGPRAGGHGAPQVGPNTASVPYMSVARARARQMFRNDPTARRAVRFLTNAVIGRGMFPMLNIDDQELKEKIETLFDRWGKKAIVGGWTNFYGYQSVAFREAIVAGELFTRYRMRDPEDGLPVPLQLEGLQSEFCPESVTQDYQGNRIVGGIELSPRQQRLAYWMHKSHPSDSLMGMNYATHDLVRLDARRVAHLHFPDEIGQLRGFTALSAVLQTIREVRDYDEAERIRKRNAAMISGVITRQATGVLTNLEQAGQEGFDDAGATPDPQYADGFLPVEWAPGTNISLDPGEDWKPSAPADLGGQYQAFMKQQNMTIAAGLNIPYEYLVMDWSAVNDRTGRMFLEELKRWCRSIQDHYLIPQLLDPTWVMFIDAAILSGAIELPRGMDINELYDVEWAGDPWPYINPETDVNAAIKAIEAGIESREAVVSARGGSAARIDRQNAKDNERVDSLGLVYSSDGRHTVGKPKKETADEEMV
jgi:lambda family phage portal protein